MTVQNKEFTTEHQDLMNTVWSPQWARGLFLVGQLDVFAIGQSEDLDTMIAAGQSEDQDKVFTICSRSEDLDTVFDIGKSEDVDTLFDIGKSEAECCFTTTETIGLLGTGAQGGYLDFHTAPEL